MVCEAGLLVADIINPKALNTIDIITPAPSPKIWKNRGGEILIHGNGRYGYSIIRFYGLKSSIASNFFQRPDLDNSLLKDIPQEP